MQYNEHQLRRISLISGILGVALLAGCSNMSSCEKGVAAGGAIGGIAGSVLTDGSTVGTVGDAVAGGVLGSQHKGC